MKDKPLTIRLEVSTMERLDAVAREGESRSATIERMILDGLDRPADTNAKERAERAEAERDAAQAVAEAAGETIKAQRGALDRYEKELDAKNEQIKKLADAINAAQVSNALTIAASRPRLLDRVRALFSAKSTDGGNI